MGGIDDARAILSAMLGCVSTVLALIFSVALLVLSMVANLFGPRLLYRFVQDWVTQTCIGIFMGAFIYVFLVFLVTHQDAHSSFIPQVSLITSWFLVLGAFGFLSSTVIELGRHRVLAQDLEFGIAQIVEIAIRALSPAVNDTFTGVASVDLLGEALTVLAEARPIGGNWYGKRPPLRHEVE